MTSSEHRLLRAWLAANGLAQDVELLVSHRVDLGILPELTERDFEALGDPAR